MQPGGFPPLDGRGAVVRVHPEDQRHFGPVLRGPLPRLREDGGCEGAEVLQGRQQELRPEEGDVLPHRPRPRHPGGKRQVGGFIQ